MRHRTPLAELSRFNLDVSRNQDKSTKRRRWLLDTPDEHSLDLLQDFNKQQIVTAKQSRRPTLTSQCTEQPRQHLWSYEHIFMVREDIAGRLIKRVQLISEREQIELAIQAQSKGDTHRNCLQLVKSNKKTFKLKQHLFQFGLSRKQLQDRISVLEVEIGEHQQLIKVIQEQMGQTVAQQIHRQGDYQCKLLEFAEKHSLLKVVMQFLIEYRQAQQSRREGIRTHFIRFQKAILPGNRFQQIDKLTDQLKTNYTRLAKEYATIYISIGQARERVVELQQKSIEEVKEAQRQMMSIQVNEQIGYLELSQAKKDEQLCQMSNQQVILQKTDTIFLQYYQQHCETFDDLEKKYGRQFRRRLLEETKHKFYLIIKEQALHEAKQSTNLTKRLTLLIDLIDHNTESVEKMLVPQLRILYNNHRLDSLISVKELRPSNTEISQLCRIKNNKYRLPCKDRRELASELFEAESRNRRRSHDEVEYLCKRSLDKRQVRMSIHQQQLGRNNQVFKLKKNSLRTTDNNDRLITQTIDIRTTEHSLGHKSIIVDGYIGNMKQLLSVTRQLHIQVSVYKKSYASTPTFALEDNLMQMGYASRLLSLSPELNLEFRIGKNPNYRSINLKTPKVDQMIQLQRVRKLEKVRPGHCFSLCLDRGVLEIVFRIEDQFIYWFSGLTTLLKNRSLQTKLKNRL